MDEKQLLNNADSSGSRGSLQGFLGTRLPMCRGSGELQRHFC